MRSIGFLAGNFGLGGLDVYFWKMGEYGGLEVGDGRIFR
jgi:hypothetical protein